jgi:hypothetical protein
MGGSPAQGGYGKNHNAADENFRQQHLILLASYEYAGLPLCTEPDIA